ncbi:hypothetical protein [uncultured Fibrobacter sp.]|uniref:glucuronyl esterase domain-containing protein n=1 Tax=uncultured Fibrobacter sp. TaxID=261512 RepID=UPI0025DB32FF|nr:hypothetical protein [uncultured Fibrobacter sp.]
MNKWMKVMPVAVAAFGLWACGDEAMTSAAQCTTKECLEQVGQSYGYVPGDGSSSSAATENPGESSSDGASGEVASSSSDALDGSTSGSSSSKDVASSSSAKNPFSSSSSVLIMPTPSSSSRAISQSSSSETKTSSAAESSSSKVSSSSEAQTESPSFVEDHRSECQIGDIPSSVNNSKLPDPFKKLDGTRISSKADWKCRREEIGAMYEKLMFGTKPRNPEKVEGSYSGGKLTIKVTDKGKSGSFSVKISNAGTKDKPKPAMIGFGGGMMGGCGSLGNATNGLDIAQITFNPDDVAPESGGGMFFQLYNQGQGTIIAWAWGVSRIIDALEKTPEAGIDVKHLAMTGCSRWGKGTLAVGAFDERIALTIPQESGSGGASLWRVGAQVNKQKGKQFVQGLASAGTEGKWMISSFKSYDGRENTLPFDQHMLVAMVAPRALLILDNAGQEWLGEVPSNYCGQASKEVYDALGATENYTYSQEGGHGHCQLPNGQFDEVKDFMNKFLLGKDAKTGKIDYSKNTQTINFKKSEWIDWETPNLK